MDLIKKAQTAQNGQSRKRRHGPPRTFFMWFTDNSDPSADDIAEVRETNITTDSRTLVLDISVP